MDANLFEMIGCCFYYMKQYFRHPCSRVYGVQIHVDLIQFNRIFSLSGIRTSWRQIMGGPCSKIRCISSLPFWYPCGLTFHVTVLFSAVQVLNRFVSHFGWKSPATPAHAWCATTPVNACRLFAKKMHMDLCTRAYSTVCHGGYCELILSLARTIVHHHHSLI